MQRVEVLRDINRQLCVRHMPIYRDRDMRHELVLRACPHLQHLELAIDVSRYKLPRLSDLHYLTPRLRSLCLMALVEWTN